MSTDILAELQRLINWQVPQQERVLEHIFKAGSMLQILLTSDLQAHSITNLHHFLWQLNDIIGQAQIQGEQLLDTLLRAKHLCEPPQGSSGGTLYH